MDILIKREKTTIDKVALKAGYSRSYLMSIRSGKKRWNNDVLAALAEVLNCSQADLIADTSDKYEETALPEPSVAIADSMGRVLSLLVAKGLLTKREINALLNPLQDKYAELGQKESADTVALLLSRAENKPS